MWNKSITPFILILVLVALVQPSGAQIPIQADSTLTLSACIDSVQKYSFLLQAGEHRAEAAKQNVEIGRASCRERG